MADSLIVFPFPSNLIDDILSPAAQVVAVFVVSFLPLIVAGFCLRENAPNALLIYGLLGFGLLYAPMAMLAVVVLGYIGALSPHIVIPSIFRVGWMYLLVVFTLCLLYFAEATIGKMLDGMFIVRHLAMAVVGIFVMMANGRLLGLLYRGRQEKLCWL